MTVVSSNNSYIFVHVEGLHIFEGDFASLVELDELLVHSIWGATYKKGMRYIDILNKTK